MISTEEFLYPKFLGFFYYIIFIYFALTWLFNPCAPFDNQWHYFGKAQLENANDGVTIDLFTIFYSLSNLGFWILNNAKLP